MAKENNKKLVVFSFKRDTGIRHYNDTKYDEGDGWKQYENWVEVEGVWFHESIGSPISFINSYMQKNNATILQLIEVDGYEHLRIYLEVPSDAANLDLTPDPYPGQ